jgi:hypothetical protein
MWSPSISVKLIDKTTDDFGLVRKSQINVFFETHDVIHKFSTNALNDETIDINCNNE